MLLKLLLLIVGISQAEQLDKFKTAVRKLCYFDMETCNDINIIDIRNNIEKFKEEYFTSDKIMEEEDRLVPEDIIFGNATKLLNTLYENVFQKLRSLQNCKNLQKDNSIVNVQSCCIKNKVYNNSRYLEYMNDKQLRNHGKYLMCVIEALTTSTGNYSSIKESLRPLQIVLHDENSSLPMLVFLNKFLSNTIECDPIYTAIYVDYAINQLETIDVFNKTQLMYIHNKNDLQVLDYMKKLKQSNPEGIATLALDWRFKLDDALTKTKMAEHLRVMDQTFQQAVQRKIISSNRRAIDGGPLNIFKPQKNKKGADSDNILRQIKSKIKALRNPTSRVLRTISHINNILKLSNTSTSLLQFIDDYVYKMSNNITNIMPDICNYMVRELSILEPVNSSDIESLYDIRLEEMSTILSEYMDKEPASMITLALDWLFNLKVQLVKQRRNGNVFEILNKTFVKAKKRRQQRTTLHSIKKEQRNYKATHFLSSRKIILDHADLKKIKNALGY